MRQSMKWLGIIATLGMITQVEALDFQDQGTWGKTIQKLREDVKKDIVLNSFKLFDSGVIGLEKGAVPIDMNLTGVKELKLSAIAPMGNASAHAVWQNLMVTYADGSQKPLTEMQLLEESVGWDKLRKNTDNEGHSLKVGNTIGTHSFWAHADSSIIVKIGENAVRLTGYCGLNQGRNGKVRFIINTAAVDSFFLQLEKSYGKQTNLLKAYNKNLLKTTIQEYNDKEIIEKLIKQLGQASKTAKAYQALADKNQNNPELAEITIQAIQEYFDMQNAIRQAKSINIAALKRTINDLEKTYADKYDGEKYIEQLEKYEKDLPNLLQTVEKLNDNNDGKNWISRNATLETSELVEAHSRNKGKLLTGNNNAEWAFHSIDNADKPWIVIDLGSSQELTNIQIDNRPGFDERAKQLTISVSDDKSTWTEAWANNGKGQKKWSVDLASGTKARYVKLWLNGRGTFHLKSVKIFGKQVEQQEDSKMEAIAKLIELSQLRQRILLSNPLLKDFDQIIAIVREEGKKCLPANWAGNTSLRGNATSVKNKIITFPFKDLEMPATTIYEPKENVFVGEVDLHFNGKKMLFSMPKKVANGSIVWHLWELNIDEKGTPIDQPRQLTDDSVTDYDCYDPCYLPNGKIIFNATIGYQGVPCVNGNDYVGNLCIMNADGTGMRRLTYDQDNNWDPVVKNDGTIMYQRWEYTDSAHYFSRMIFDMYPDGREQRAMYGSNSYWPNSMFYARPIPGDDTKFIAVVTGHHGEKREGELILFDTSLGRHEEKGVVQRIPGYGKKVVPVVKDQLVQGVYPRFLHPYPLSDKYFLVSCQPSPSDKWGIYLVDTFDNMLLLKEMPGQVLYEPIPLRSRPTPPIIPDAVNLKSNEATVYITDVYEGPGLAGVPKGVVKELVIYAYEYAFRNTGNHDAVGMEGPWDVRKVIGTVPVYEDGSASFKIPANVPVAVLPLDANGNAMQLFRSWFVGVPGEVVSCVGCHENRDTPPPTKTTIAYTKKPVTPKAFKGPFRGFSFDREIQPILDKYCIGCHNKDAAQSAHMSNKAKPNFSPNRPWISPNSKAHYSASYCELMPYVRRNGPEGVWYVLTPLEFHFGVTQLGQMLQKGHHGVNLDKDSWERLSMWVNMNLPAIGRWTEFEPQKVPKEKIDRIRELRQKYAGVATTSEDLIVIDPPKYDFIAPTPVRKPAQPKQLSGWPMDTNAAIAKQQALGKITNTIEGIDLVKIPAGTFLMGNPQGTPDENAVHQVKIDNAFWMGKTEISVAQFRQFRQEWKNGYYDRHWKDQTNPGYNMDVDSNYPVIRISYEEAEAFCKWLSDKTGKKVRLPSEDEWEWACRAGSDQDFHFGQITNDGVKFGKYANLADAKVREMAVRGIDPQPIWRVNDKNYLQLPSGKGNQLMDFEPYDTREYDGTLMLAPVGKYQPNPWGLHDMHGNVAEWTSTPYAPYGKKVNKKPGHLEMHGNVVRGGSWYDRPYRSTAGFRLAYPKWQKPFNVGFRIVVED